MKTAANALCVAVGRSRRGSKGLGAEEATGDRVADSGRVGDGPPLDVLSSLENTIEMTTLITLSAHDQLLTSCSQSVVVLDQDADRYTIAHGNGRIAIDLPVSDCWYVGAHADRLFFGTDSGESCVVYECSAYEAEPTRCYRVPFLVRCADFFANTSVLVSGDDGAAVISLSGVEKVFEASALSTHISHRAVVVDDPYVVALSTDFGVECRRFDDEAEFTLQWTRFAAADSSVTAGRLLRLTRGAVAIECAERGPAFIDVVTTDSETLLRRHVDVARALHSFDGTLVFGTPTIIYAVGAFSGEQQWRIELREVGSAGDRGAAFELSHPPVAFARGTLWVQDGVMLRQFTLNGLERSAFEVSPMSVLVASTSDAVIVQAANRLRHDCE